MKDSSMCASAVEHTLASLVTGNGPLAVACSGGPDSMALVLLAQEWAKSYRGASESVDERAVSASHPTPRHAKGSRLSRAHYITAITVDHGLRKESAKEAEQVGKWLKKRGIKHVVLRWEGTKPKSNIQEEARHARYTLLADYCKAHDIKNLLVAHTLDDQAETFLLRLKRGSGVDGLAAMAETTRMDGIKILRPLLGVKKTELISYLKEKKQDFIHDPSNENLDFDRVKIRKAMPALANIGIDAAKLAKTAGAMARARKFLQKKTADFIEQHGQIFPEGYAILSHLPESEELALRVLAFLLMAIGGHKVRPRLDELERLYFQLSCHSRAGGNLSQDPRLRGGDNSLKSPTFKTATLGGCIWTALPSPLKAGGIYTERQLLIFREQKALPAPIAIKKGKPLTWDRFEIHWQLPTTNGQLGPLTQQGWLELSKKHGLKNTYPDKRILYTLPALRNNKGRIIAVPHLGIGDDVAIRSIYITEVG